MTCFPLLLSLRVTGASLSTNAISEPSVIEAASDGSATTCLIKSNVMPIFLSANSFFVIFSHPSCIAPCTTPPVLQILFRISQRIVQVRNGDGLLDFIAFHAEQIAMEKTVGTVISDDRVPLFLYPRFILNNH